MPNHSTQSSRRTRAGVIPIEDASGRIVAGFRVVDATLQKDVSQGHYLTTPPALAFDLVVLDRAEALCRAHCPWADGAVQVEIHNVDSGKTLRASMATVRGKGFRVSRRYGEQWALGLGNWDVEGEQKQAHEPRHDTPKPAVVQLDLWGNR